MISVDATKKILSWGAIAKKIVGIENKAIARVGGQKSEIGAEASRVGERECEEIGDERIQ